MYSVSITSLPQDDMWKALPIPTTEVDIFVGVMSTTNHFRERMAIRRRCGAVMRQVEERKAELHGEEDLQR